MAKGQPGEKVHKIPFQPTAGCSGVCLTSQAIWEARIRKILVLGQPRPKKSMRTYLNRKKVRYGATYLL
jgi:hypothetical protein